MPRSVRRSLSPEIQSEYMETRHRRIDEQCTQLESRRALTDDEELQLAQLKKEKLRLKDALGSL